MEDLQERKERISYELAEKGYYIENIAERFGLDPNTVSKMVSEYRTKLRGKKVEKEQST